MLTRVGLTLGMVAAALATSAQGSVTAAEESARAVELRVMTWNIQHGTANGGDPDGPSDLERVAAVIRAEHPDVVTLNEIHDDEDFDGSHGHQPDILRSLLEPAGYAHSFYGVSEVHGPGHPGTRGELILSKYPIYDAAGDPRSPEVIELPTQNAHPGEPNRRALVKVTLDVPGSADVRVYATHLSPPASEEQVLDQLDQAQTILDNMPRLDQPVVVAGDFNIRPTNSPNPISRNSTIKSWIASHGLVDTWTVVNKSEDGVTRPNSYGNPTGDHPDRRIDYVFASPKFDVRSGHVSLVDRDASDHLAVVTDLRLRAAEVVASRSAPAGDSAEEGWAHLAHGDDGRAKLTVCKNAGTDVDDGWTVEARVYRSGSDEPVRVERDGGTSRDRCQTDLWRGPASSALETCLVRDDVVTQCRRVPVRAH